MDKNSSFHGSDFDIIAKKYCININNMIKFSDNINPNKISNTMMNNISDNINLIYDYPNKNNTNLVKKNS